MTEESMKVNKGDQELTVAPGFEWFWRQFDDGSWEPQTFEVMEYFLRKDRDYFDIGAWIGPTVLFGAPRCKDVYAFEPDPVAYKALLDNLELNSIPNCAAMQVAAGDTNGVLKMGIRTAQGDSMSSMLWEKDAIDVISLDVSALIRTKNPNFIKMDIEGGEFYVLPSMKDALLEMKPTLYLSLHPAWFDDKMAYMDVIADVMSVYPHLYDDKKNPIEIKDIPLEGFSAIIGTFESVI